MSSNSIGSLRFVTTFLYVLLSWQVIGVDGWASLAGNVGSFGRPRVAGNHENGIACPKVSTCKTQTTMTVSGSQKGGWREFIKSWTKVRGRGGGKSLVSFAKDVGVAPPLLAPRWFWKLAWELFKLALAPLHFLDPLAPRESFLNLRILWWKAIAANRRIPPIADDGLAYDLLPPLSRFVVRWPLCFLFPRLHHQLVVLRTAFLDRACAAEIAKHQSEGKTVVMVSLGAGFDTRSLRLRPDTAVEVDLPDVMHSKGRLLRERLLPRRPQLESKLPVLVPADLNDVEASMASLRKGVAEATARGGACAAGATASEETGVHLLFVVEAVLMYLDEGRPAQVLQGLSAAALDVGATASLAFADRLPIPLGEPEETARRGSELLRGAGFRLEGWRCEHSLNARHLGTATLNAREDNTPPR